MTDHNGTVLRLEAVGVSKSYGAVKALDDVGFEVRQGEVMALLGENGAGKSTIVKVISGLVSPDAGRILIDGEVTDITSSARAQQSGIAVVQQEYSSVPTMSVAENLALGTVDSGAIWTRRRLADDARKLLELVGLGRLDPSTLVADLSVAEMQLLEIARVVARDARLVVFDEPTAALSDAEIVRVLDVVRNLVGRGISVVYVTHRLPEVFEVADRVTVFRNGRSLAPVATSDLDVDDVITMMLGRELSAMYPAKAGKLSEARMEMRDLRVAGIRDGLNLTVRRGEILGLTGQLGSGTDALMECLAGIRPIAGGQVVIDGEPVSLRTRMAGIRAGIAYCSDDRKRDGIFSERSIQENLSSSWLPSVTRLGFVSGRAERTRASDIASQFAIDTDRLRTRVGTLSGGNQQKVALGKWVGSSPRVLLVQEPTRGVDVGARSEIYRKLRELCAEGMSVVVSSSDTAEVFGLADTIATFYHGHLTALRSAEEWTQEQVVRAVMHREVTP
jgi:ribose transport system ATP-binding protein